MCLAGAMIIGTTIFTITHDLHQESGHAKYWPLLAFYMSDVLVWTKVNHSFALYMGAVMAFALLLMALDDYLTAKRWGMSAPSPDSAQQ